MAFPSLGRGDGRKTVPSDNTKSSPSGEGKEDEPMLGITFCQPVLDALQRTTWERIAQMATTLTHPDQFLNVDSLADYLAEEETEGSAVDLASSKITIEMIKEAGRFEAEEMDLVDQTLAALEQHAVTKKGRKRTRSTSGQSTLAEGRTVELLIDGESQGDHSRATGVAYSSLYYMVQDMLEGYFEVSGAKAVNAIAPWDAIRTGLVSTDFAVGSTTHTHGDHTYEVIVTAA